VITLTTLLQQHGATYREQRRTQLSPQQSRCLATLALCRTEALGGQVFTCPDCHTVRYSYHSCRNRHCPTCQQEAGTIWLANQQSLLLPVPYFLVTFTIPASLRAVAAAHQHAVYTAMFRSSAAALQALAADPRHLGGQLGMLGVLHTWTWDLRYHPHIHYLIPGVGVTPEQRVVFPPAPDFLLPGRPLALLFRVKLRASLQQQPWANALPAAAWQQDWVVDCRPVGTGNAALKYLAPYIFRVALSNNRILQADDHQVTFRYTHRATKEQRRSTVSVTTFLDRFAAHILPAGFVKVRYYGFFRPAARQMLPRLRAQIQLMRGMGLLDPPAVTDPVQQHHHPHGCPSCDAPMRVTVLSAHTACAPPHTGTRSMPCA